jgi:hypothetical protein
MTGFHVKRVRLIVLAITLIISLPVLSLAQQQQRRPRTSGGMFEEFPNRIPKAGEMAPDFTLKTLDGDTFTLSEAIADGPVVIEFGSYT